MIKLGVLGSTKGTDLEKIIELLEKVLGFLKFF